MEYKVLIFQYRKILNKLLIFAEKNEEIDYLL